MAELDEVKDGEDSEDKEEVTVETNGGAGYRELTQQLCPQEGLARRDANRTELTRTFLPALHFHLGL